MSAGLESSGKCLLGLLPGAAFGALLRRGRVSRYEVIEAQLRGRDSRVVKTMATAALVAGLGVSALARRGLTTKDIKPMKVGGVLGGAALFGTGLAVAGYCPGTSLAAVGEGKRDALAVVLGMCAGAVAFVAAYPRLRPLIDAGDLGKRTLTRPRSPALATART